MSPVHMRAGLLDRHVHHASIHALNGAARILGSLLVGFVFAFWCSLAHAQSVTPSMGACDSRIWISQSNTLYSVNTATNPFIFTPVGTSDFDINAGDFNPADGYLYGIARDPIRNHLFLLGSNGVAVDRGEVANLPLMVGATSVAYISGGFDSTGDTLYVLNNIVPTVRFYAVNIATLSATETTLSRAVSIADIAFVDGFFYSIERSGQMIRINPATGAVTNIGPLNGATNGVDVGGIIGAPNGLFGIANNGGFYQFNTTTGAATFLSGAPSSSANDAYHCANAALAFGADLSITKTNTPGQNGEVDLPSDTYAPGTRTYTIVARNSGPFGAQAQTVSDILPVGITSANWTCSGTGGGVCASASGTGGIDNASIDLPVGGSVTFLLTMTVPESVTGNLSNTATIIAGDTVIDSDPSNNSATDVDAPAPLVTISKISLGGVGAFSFTGTNGLGSQTLTTTAAGTPVAGALQALTTPSAATSITEGAPPTGYDLTAVSCTGLGAGGTAVTDLAARTVVLDAAATVTGARIVCTFTNILQPTLTLAKSWSGAVVNDSATLSATGGSASPSLVSVANAPAETDTGVASRVAVGNVISLSEVLGSANAGSYTPSAWSCTAGTLAGDALTIGAEDAGQAIVCTITNTRQQADLAIVKTVTPTIAKPGEVVTYTIIATNNGPDAGDGAVIHDLPGTGLDCTVPIPTVDCSGSGGAVCSAPTFSFASLSGTGIAIPTFPNGSQIILVHKCTITATGQP